MTRWPELALECAYSVSQIARRCGVTVPQFRSFCRHQLGCGAKRWLRELRLAQAEVWLDARLSSEAVARQLHFRDAPHFCREFKRARGVSPQAWRASRVWWRRVSGQELPFTPVRLPTPPKARVFPSERDFPWLGV